MTRSVYLVGGAGAGKSTFMAQLLEELAEPMSDLVDLHMKRNTRGARITLRGHWLGGDGLYLGVWREGPHPGTDGLDRVSPVPGEEWLDTCELPSFIVGEGKTLATRRFLSALQRNTDMLLFHLHVDADEAVHRFAERGTAQAESFVRSSVTSAAKVADEYGGVDVDSADEFEWGFAMDRAVDHLRSLNT